MLKLDVQNMRRDTDELLQAIGEACDAPPNTPEAMRGCECDDCSDPVIVESRIAETADVAFEVIGEAIDAEQALRLHLRFYDRVAIDCSPEDVAKATAITHAVVTQWIERTTAAIPLFAPWREECRAMGYDLAGWLAWEQSVGHYQQEERRLSAVLNTKE